MKTKCSTIIASLILFFGSIALARADNGTVVQADHISICSFNIQFLGSSKHRNDEALASVVKDCDVVVVQELVAPPYKMKFPDCSDAKADSESAEFFDEMIKLDFTYWLSAEDTRPCLLLAGGCFVWQDSLPPI